MKKLLKRILPIAIILAVFALLAWQLAQNGEALRDLPWGERPATLLGAALCGLLVYPLTALGWMLVLRGLGNRWPVPLAASTFLAPNIGKYVPGKVGMVLARIELCRQFGQERALTLSGLVFEHVLHFSSTLPFSAWFFGMIAVESSSQATLVTVGVSLVCLLFIARPRLVRWAVNLLLTRLKKPPLTVSPSTLGLLGVWPVYFLSWVGYGLAGWLFVQALGFDERLGPLVTMAACVVSWQVGFLSFLTPGGLGVREVALAALLAPWLERHECVLLALLLRLVWTVSELLGVLFGVLWLRAASKAPEEAEPAAP